MPHKDFPKDPPTQDESDPTDAAADATIEELDRVEVEARFVAERIAQMVGGGKPQLQVYDRHTNAYRDVAYRDIVILLRSTRYRAPAYTEALAARNIPVHADLATGYFTSAEIEDMLNLLRVIDNPRQDIPLAAVLRSPLVGLSEPELVCVDR